MAKLYWRLKRDGKWTWVAATPENTQYSLHREAAYYDGKELCIDGKFIEDDDAVVEKPEVIDRIEEETCFICENVGEGECHEHGQQG